MAALNKRTTHVNSIREIRRFVEGDEFENASKQRLIVLQTALKRHFDQFFESHHELIDGQIAQAEFIVHETLKNEIESIVNDIEVAILERIDLINQRNVQPEPVQEQQQNNQLPAFEMSYLVHQGIDNVCGEFDGTLWKWASFRDLFVSTVHESNILTNVIKLRCLIRSLTGDAAEVLGNWSITNDNYPLAWERLNQVYNRTHQAGTDLLQRLYELPALKRATQKDLQHLSNVTNDVKRQVTALGYATNSWDLMFITTLEQKLDNKTKIEWELQRNQEEPTLNHLLDFIEKRARALSYLPDEMDESDESCESDDETFEHEMESDQMERANNYKSYTPKKCLIPDCNSTHPLYRCSDFLAKSLNDREQFVKKNRLCVRCFNTGHFAKHCFLGECRQCQQKHNFTLCPKNIRALCPLLNKRNSN